jgi:hypothetical protein
MVWILLGLFKDWRFFMTQEIGPGFGISVGLGFRGFSVYWFLDFLKDLEIDSHRLAFIGCSDQQYKDCSCFFFVITFSIFSPKASIFGHFYSMCEL